MKSVSIIAHRGLSDRFPENTALSIRQAIALEADYCEFDVTITDDEQVVLMHDDTLERTTNGKGLVSQKNWEELKGLDAGSWKSSEFKGEPVPLLKDILPLFANKKCKPVIEIKESGTTDQVVEMVVQAELAQRAVIISYHQDVVQQVSASKTGIRSGWIYGRSSKLYAPDRTADFLADVLEACGTNLLDISYKVLDKDLARGLRQRNCEIWIYTANDKKAFDKYRSFEISGFTTDRADVLLKLKKS